jgi:hypothetical protein
MNEASAATTGGVAVDALNVKHYVFDNTLRFGIRVLMFVRCTAVAAYWARGLALAIGFCPALP